MIKDIFFRVQKMNSLKDPKKQRKTSIGIALCRRHPETKIPQILLVKSRLTYNFSSFVFGKYKPWDTEKLQYLFDNMTHHEKILVWSCDFSKMWYHIWLRIPTVDNPNDTFWTFYLNCKAKFDKLISKDSGKRIRFLLNHAKSIELGWEIPKGRQEEMESELDCGIREMKEETNISEDDYHILTRIKPLCSSYEDENTIYVSKYFVAWTKKSFDTQINFNNIHQISEISDIKWLTLREANLLVAQNRYLKKQAKLALTLFKREVAYKEIVNH